MTDTNDKYIRTYTCFTCQRKFTTDEPLEETVQRGVAKFGKDLLEGPPQEVCKNCYRILMRDHARKN